MYMGLLPAGHQVHAPSSLQVSLAVVGVTATLGCATWQVPERHRSKCAS